MSSLRDRLFYLYLVPYFLPHALQEVGATTFRVLGVQRHIGVGYGSSAPVFEVTAVDPPGAYGIVDRHTEIFVEEGPESDAPPGDPGGADFNGAGMGRTLEKFVMKAVEEAGLGESKSQGSESC